VYRRLADDMRGSMARASTFAQPEWKEKALGKAVMFGYQDSRPIQEQRRGLPIYPFREQIIQGVKENQIIILSAETGSGKTTQVTQYLAEAGWTSRVCSCAAASI
jgi:ATP-dependent RNA helicase DHX8/PRP22